MSYCAHCGAELVENAAFCPACGKPTKSRGSIWRSPAAGGRKLSPFEWVFIVINCGFLALLALGLSAGDTAMQEVMTLVELWAAVDVVLAIIWYVTK